jgi:hypothetical protein
VGSRPPPERMGYALEQRLREGGVDEYDVTP